MKKSTRPRMSYKNGEIKYMTIVCVDINRFVLHDLKKKVQRIMPEASVHTCRRTKKALEIVEKKGCDVLITEIDFDGQKEEGIQLAHKVKDINPSVNIIFVTACSARDYAQQIVKLKYSGYLTKPFSNEELAIELANLRYGQELI